jgi:hypothetical protein
MRPTGDGYKAPRRQRGPKGQPFRNVLGMGSLFGRLHYLHPTKGWRFRRANPVMIAMLPRKA